MFELASAMFSIADANEFRFARFYIVCEAASLGTLESPLIVCGLSDTLRECPNVEETRNGMPAAIWKKYTNFASKNLRHLFIPELSTICFLSSKQDFYDMLFLCIQLFDPLLFDPHGICCPRFRFQLLFIAEDTFYPLFFTLALFRI